MKNGEKIDKNAKGSYIMCPLDSAIGVKLGIRTEMSGLKLCKVLASTCRLRCSLDGCLEFWRSGVELRRSLRQMRAN